MDELKNWELTPEEIADISTADREYGVIEVGDVSKCDRAIADAAVKKLVEWLNPRVLVSVTQCPLCSEYIHDEYHCHIEVEDWDNLKQEVGL